MPTRFFLGLQTGYIVHLFSCAAGSRRTSWQVHPPSAHVPIVTLLTFYLTFTNFRISDCTFPSPFIVA
jgi:hypothetical protein